MKLGKFLEKGIIATKESSDETKFVLHSAEVLVRDDQGNLHPVSSLGIKYDSDGKPYFVIHAEDTIVDISLA